MHDSEFFFYVPSHWYCLLLDQATGLAVDRLHKHTNISVFNIGRYYKGVVYVIIMYSFISFIFVTWGANSYIINKKIFGFSWSKTKSLCELPIIAATSRLRLKNEAPLVKRENFVPIAEKRFQRLAIVTTKIPQNLFYIIMFRRDKDKHAFLPASIQQQ